MLLPQLNELKIKFQKIFQDYNFDFVVNCAALTNLDFAESNSEIAQKTNKIGVANLIDGCKLRNTKLIQISTNAVFSSVGPFFHKKSDKTNPENEYGKSKEDAENLIKSQYNSNSLIIRTSWLYGKYGGQFFQNIMNFARRQERIQVVNDQFGQPTTTFDMAKLIAFSLLHDLSGLIHLVPETYCSRFEFAKLIYQKFGANVDLVSPMTTNYSNALAKRTQFSLLDPDLEIMTQCNVSGDWKHNLQSLIPLPDAETLGRPND